jgi:alpha-mannosidase
LNHKTIWTAEKIAQRLNLIAPLVYRRRQPLAPFRFKQLKGPAALPLTEPELDTAAWEVIEPNTYWASWQVDFCLRNQFQSPSDWSASEPIALLFELGKSGDFEHPEALAYIDGKAYGTVDRHHPEILLPQEWLDGQAHSLTLHGWTGNGAEHNTPANTRLFMGESALVQLDMPTRNFIATSRVAMGIAKILSEDSPTKGLLLTALNEAFKKLDSREPQGEAFYASVPEATQILKDGIAKAGPALEVDVTATGHAHIDTAWLWTLGQTRRKAGRTFTNVLRFMEQFPDYHYTQSQPQLYDYVRQDYPELFEGIKARVADGRWEPIGGMWVEADCNLSGPESLARQFLLGRSFFKEHFGSGTDSKVLWLPDVFGYAWNLPQLIKQAGLEYFFTIKIGWSQYNRLPFDSFWWQGLDGTKVLTHFSPTPENGSVYASTYNAEVSPEQAVRTWTNFRQKDLAGVDSAPPLLMAFGFGDGGGGPTREMLENLREMGDFPATPKLKAGSVQKFFEDLDARAGKALPTWNGELYLELHRGTYTTQSRNKRANRKSEFLLHDAEFLAAYASVLAASYQYPTAELRKAWELVCLNQFHDIIPGSSIGAVYVDSQAQYKQIREVGEKLKGEALAAIGKQTGGDILIADPTGWGRLGLGLWKGELAEGQSILDSDGRAVPTQTVEEGVLIKISTEPYTVNPLFVGSSEGKAVTANELMASPTLLENLFLRVELNANGDITRIYDKVAKREVMPPDALANQFLAFEDRPMNWDAWDVDIFYSDKRWLAEPAESVTVREVGPLRATLEIKRRILNSNYVQRISLESGSSKIDFETTIDWREKYTLLKVAFPVEVLSPMATYEIQWGQVQRPTHWNTSWDWARFETCAQKWVDLSEGGFGVSLLNDCKYGHDIRDNVIRLSLLRSPTSPDPHADEGVHQFAYSLLPHAGTDLTETIAEAYGLNDPLICWSNPTPKKAAERDENGLVWFEYPEDEDAPQPIIETVKQAEDGQGLIIRLYEGQRRRGTVSLRAGFSIRAAWQTNLLEENQQALEITGEGVSFNLNPFQIVTLRLAF